MQRTVETPAQKRFMKTYNIPKLKRLKSAINSKPDVNRTSSPSDYITNNQTLACKLNYNQVVIKGDHHRIKTTSSDSKKPSLYKLKCAKRNKIHVQKAT